MEMRPLKRRRKVWYKEEQSDYDDEEAAVTKPLLLENNMEAKERENTPKKQGSAGIFPDNTKKGAMVTKPFLPGNYKETKERENTPKKRGPAGIFPANTKKEATVDTSLERSQQERYLEEETGFDYPPELTEAELPSTSEKRRRKQRKPEPMSTFPVLSLNNADDF